MTSSVSSTLAALADDTRRTTMEALVSGPLSAGELAIRLHVTPAALTRHLKVLRLAGLVTVSLDQADTRRHVYTVQPDPLQSLSHWAAQIAEFWKAQLTSFTDHARTGHAGR
ncbi:MAG: ArsR/SmtB family transcription factor [Actinomycetota bacterium]